MTLGFASRQESLFDGVARFCAEALSDDSVYSVLYRERDRLFPDEMFADLYQDRGRASVPPSIVATVMVLQRLEGLSDREAVERYTFDTRWRYAAGVGGYDCDGWGRFAHTVLVDMRARLRDSDDPRRIFDVTVAAASAAGLVGARRVLDSTPLYDAVATMDTITLIRSAIRGLLRVVDPVLEAELRSVLTSGDDYTDSAKPQIDWDDPDARDSLIDTRAKDAHALLIALDGRELGVEAGEAAELLATVVGQDLDKTEDGIFRIARRVAKDRVISTVDPEARHGHKSSSRGFDGYKGHVAIDPDSEIITDTVVTAGNAGDASVAGELICDILDAGAAETGPADENAGHDDRPTVYGDAAYGTGEFLDRLAGSDVDSRLKTQPPHARGDLFTKDRFGVNLADGTVTCPGEETVDIHRDGNGDGVAYFADACSGCQLRDQCTTSPRGRTIRVSRYEQRLATARAEQSNPDWLADYRATRPKVERKLAHMMRRRHGGRRARMRGKKKVDADFNLLAAALNITRLAKTGLFNTT